MDANIPQGGETFAHQPCTNSLTTTCRRDGKMMNEPTTTIVSDEDCTHQPSALEGNETESRISSQERRDGVL